jgi:putative ABC transport system permease protein
MLHNVLEQSLLFFPLALGIYISYGILKIPDLTTDGSFVFGAALFGVSVHQGIDPAAAVAFGAAGGALCGCAASFLQSRLNLNPLIAGILLVFILNTVTLKFMGKPNLSLFNRPSLFPPDSKLATLIPLTLALLIASACLFSSRIGLFLNAFGNNPTLLQLSGKNGNLYRTIGLSLSNGLVAFCGTLTAQAYGYADIGMGTGVVLIALGTVILGQQIYHSCFKRPSFVHLFRLLCTLAGVILYFSAVNLLIFLGLDPIYLKLMIGVSLVGFLAFTQSSKKQEAL